jgi:hypothetical protein
MAFDTGHALLIGIGTFANVPRLDVPTTAEDARQVGMVLRDPQFCGYPDSQVTILHDATATRDGILGALDALAQRVGEDDTVLLFYSGHGEDGDDGQYYLTTHDMQKNERRQVVAGTAVRHDELLDRLRQIKAKRLLLIFNACHSGTLSPVLGDTPADDDGAEGGKSLPDDTAAAVLATGEGRIIITACRESQFSFVGAGPQTIFGQALVDGLRGKGTVSSQAGFISAFDLYTHLYYAVDRAVQRIPLASRQKYAGGVQQPELTVIRGIGPFPVALYRGQSATLGDYAPGQELDEETAINRVDKRYSERMLNKIISISIGDTAGRDIKNAGRDIVEKSAGHDLIEAGGNVQQAGGNIVGGHQISGDYVGGDKFTGDKVLGDKVSGDKVVGDKIDARGSQGFINRASGPLSQNYGTQYNVDTGGGAFAAGNIDKRSGTFVEGDQFNMSGNFSGAILNIKSQLSNVSQSIGAMPNADQASKDELKQLIDQLSAVLARVPAGREDDATAVAETAKQLVDQAGKAQPNKVIVRITAEGLKSAAQNLAAVLPAVLPIATQIAATIGRMLG